MEKGILMKAFKVNDKGFSLTELMFAMTILAVGLLALAQMQIMAMRGTATSRDFSTATNLAREGIEKLKVTGLFTITGTGVLANPELYDMNYDNDDEGLHAPIINAATDISADIGFDTVELFQRDNATGLYNSVCGPNQYPLNCDAEIAAGSWNFVRITNIKNLPPDAPEHEVVMKDINVIVLWKDGGQTRSVSLRSIVARKDSDFF